MTSRGVLRGLWRAIAPARALSDKDTVGLAFRGDYQTFADAELASTGYDAADILARTRTAALMVRDGKAAFERDTVTFAAPEHRFPILAALLRAAVEADGRLSVIDFGGALGSLYYQCRHFLPAQIDLRWNIVEQPAHVACGQHEFANGQLRFFETVSACLAVDRPQVLLLSGVLQYLEAPYETLRGLLAHEFDYVIIDRTPLLNRDADRLTVQTVPSSIYPGSYPAWFFSETRLRETWREASYQLVAEFPGFDAVSLEGETNSFKGFILARAKG